MWGLIDPHTGRLPVDYDSLARFIARMETYESDGLFNVAGDINIADGSEVIVPDILRVLDSLPQEPLEMRDL